ncbi:hypothetical protein PGB90_003566 [Kerria lacca]
MLQVLEPIKNFLKIKDINRDNKVFKLHSKVTVVILIASSLTLTANQLVGNPIECLANKDIPLTVINTFCWIQGTFTLPDKLKENIGETLVSCGVGISQNGEEIEYHKYYQWVCFVLFFQAVLFYFPGYLWKIWEEDLLKSLAEIPDIFMEPNTSDDNGFKIATIITKSGTIRKNVNLWLNSLEYFFIKPSNYKNIYAIKFFICEILNFLNVILQLFLIDYFLNKTSLNFGSNILEYFFSESKDKICNPMNFIFPKETKCNFYKFGPTGTIENIDALCILPLNAVNEKIYAFLWFWLGFLSILNCFILLYRLISCLCKTIRYFKLSAVSHFSNFEAVKIIVNNSNYADFLILCHLGKNVSYQNWIELINYLSQKFQEQENKKNGKTEDKFFT